ncbi:hypothetical protein GCM10023063_11830 [Arthrobacter methylotrophus]|uniref:Uncharacterized protein n=1 Tax=Arthrobacter methylotrophus TaxID=121291 RepID=A0ABV5UQR2_9MICC
MKPLPVDSGFLPVSMNFGSGEEFPHFTESGVICSPEDDVAALKDIPGILHIVHSMADFHALSEECQSNLVVLAGGESLLRLLAAQSGLKADTTIFWLIHKRFIDTWHAISSINLPQRSAITAFISRFESSWIVIDYSEYYLDNTSFYNGYIAGLKFSDSIPQSENTKAVGSEIELSKLKQKHVNLLETLGSLDLSLPRAGVVSTEETLLTTRLENELILLKRKHDALQRKYIALSNSKLGKLTLSMWGRKRAKAAMKTDLRDK